MLKLDAHFLRLGGKGGGLIREIDEKPSRGIDK